MEINKIEKLSKGTEILSDSDIRGQRVYNPIYRIISFKNNVITFVIDEDVFEIVITPQYIRNLTKYQMGQDEFNENERKSERTESKLKKILYSILNHIEDKVDSTNELKTSDDGMIDIKSNAKLITLAIDQLYNKHNSNRGYEIKPIDFDEIKSEVTRGGHNNDEKMKIIETLTKKTFDDKKPVESDLLGEIRANVEDAWDKFTDELHSK